MGHKLFHHASHEKHQLADSLALKNIVNKPSNICKDKDKTLRLSSRMWNSTYTFKKKKKRKVVHINKQCLRIGSLNHNTAVVVTEFAYKKQKTLKLPFRLPNCVQGRCCLSRAAGREGARDASGSMISGRNQEGTRQRSAVIGCV